MKSRTIGCFLSLIVIIATGTLLAEAPPNTITYNGRQYYINGINVPWNQFGTDAGSHYEWGALYDEDFFTTFFGECLQYGVNCVRLWIHCDGRSTPEFDDDGAVTGLDENFLTDFDNILRIARENNVLVMPCLWSFDMTKDFTSTAGKYAGLHADLIQDIDKTRSYIDNALIPMVEHTKDADNLFAWEVINEPEWSIDGPGNTTQLVSATEMVRFCGMIAEAIHEHSNKMVTVGSACLKWHSTKQPPAESHYWNDAFFKQAYDKPGSYLDFYQVHYYDWMFNEDWGYDPFQSGKTPEFWELDKPTIIGESPGETGQYTVDRMVDNAFSNGYAGILPWSYNALDGHGTWDEVKTQLKAFRDAHAEMVDYTPAIVRKRFDRSPGVLPATDATITVYDLRGRLIGKTIAGSTIPNSIGVLLYQVRDRHGNSIGVKQQLAR
ncbi:MAG: cellulase family glycosylhydrolase [Chitinispirillaceae bacterium]|nr:cellulase family glycosylhydrolase [Chitinispirillaceae bacterium]